MNRNRIAIKAGVWFIGIMLFFTFASRSINYYMLPKVIEAPVTSGYVEKTITLYGVTAKEAVKGDKAVQLLLSFPDGATRFSPRMNCMVALGMESFDGCITDYSNVEKTKDEPADAPHKMLLTVEPGEGLKEDVPEGVNATLIYENSGEYYDIVVPTTALVTPDSVYILKYRKGVWGQEYYLERKQIEIDRRSDNEAAVTSGINMDDKVVISWDRELRDKAVVTLPLE